MKKEKNSFETMEEFEDSEGNVFNKKTYEGSYLFFVCYQQTTKYISPTDLKRQGLI